MTKMIAISALLALAGCSNGETAAPATPVALVTLAPVSVGNLASTEQIYGAIESGPEGQFILAAPAEAVIAAIDAPAGTLVARGSVVARLRPTPGTQAEILRSSAEVGVAQAALARARRLRADGLVSDADVETARAAAQSAAALSGSLATRQSGLVLRAPGAGHIDSIAAGVGSIVAPGTVVATISRAGDLRARFGIDSALARRLSTGQRLTITPADGGASFDAAITSIDPVVDPQTRLAAVFTRIPAELRLGPGQRLRASVATAQSTAALTIPYAALLDDAGQPYVYAVRGGVAHRQDVAVGAANGERVAIDRGITASDRVVVEGGTALEDGMRVRTR